MPINTVVGDIKLTPDKPLMLGFLEVFDKYLVPLLIPVYLLSYLCPECLRAGD
jgi:hypothetical protein